MSGSPSAGVRLATVRDALGELVPVVRRAAALDPRSLARFRLEGSTATAFVRLPFQVLVSRRVPAATSQPIDITFDCTELLAWYDGERPEEPPARDVQWRSALPPGRGWHQVDTVPDGIVRDLVRKGALALTEAARSDAAPNAHQRSDIADALLDAVVLTVTAGEGADIHAAELHTAEVTLRALSALTRMGFLPRGSHIVVSVAGRWMRVAAEYGSVYLERPGLGIGILSS